MRNRSRNVSRTQMSMNRFSQTLVQNKDPNFEYSFKRRADIENGSAEAWGWDVVNEDNNSGEVRKLDRTIKKRTGGSKQVSLIDTVLCRRDKNSDIAIYERQHENSKYNAQIQLIKTASQRSKAALRELDPGAIVVDGSKNLDRVLVQRTGPTEE